jgi:hypothetical protein
MEGIALGILINIFIYLIPIFCFFATIYFGFKSIKNSAEEIQPNKSKYLSIISACAFLFLAFVWPANFQMFMQNLELFKTVYYVQITLAPISILLLAVWLKKKYGKSTSANLLILYGVIDLSTKAPRIIESIYKIAINDHRPYATGFTKFISRYMFQINLVSTATLLLATYSLYVTLNSEKSNQSHKRTG